MLERLKSTSASTELVLSEPPDDPVVLDGQNLTIEQVNRVARRGAPVSIQDDPNITQRLAESCAYIERAVADGQPIYGVTSGFGGMANVAVSPAQAADLQNNLIWYHKTGVGPLLPFADVRAAMVLRVNSHLHGASAIRPEIVERMVLFLNANVTPHVHQYGSIGASGDLVPLTYITGALIGHDPCFAVDFDGETVDALTALRRLDLEPIRLRPKEGLAMINGTSVMGGIAANAVHDAGALLALALGAHALAIQALSGTNQSFHPFIHAHKPHPGQVWSAQQMLNLLHGSRLSRDELDGRHDYRGNDLIQDRYSLRCLPQFFGPIIDTFVQVARQVEVEMNSATDNPLIDIDQQVSYHGGNFLGQYIGVGMDQLRHAIGLTAKHLDAQIALLVTPEFSNGLPACLIGNPGRRVNMGLKGLQLTANSLMPLLGFYGNTIVDRFPTHAEQFNQNINSQGFNAANLARQSLDVFRQYLAVALIFGVQAVDLRTFRSFGHYDASATLSDATLPLYQAVRQAVGCPPSPERPYIWDDSDRPLDLDIACISADIAAEGPVFQAIAPVIQQLRALSA
ncbi:MAG TPA: aromatic amino acid ammonia-lyase [Roseiflexaceae bacterium]|nr:aromatic amino acid ammonia-lyase [Roseiflexaceae bacterium]